MCSSTGRSGETHAGALWRRDIAHARHDDAHHGDAELRPRQVDRDDAREAGGPEAVEQPGDLAGRGNGRACRDRVEGAVPDILAHRFDALPDSAAINRREVGETDIIRYAAIVASRACSASSRHLTSATSQSAWAAMPQALAAGGSGPVPDSTRLQSRTATPISDVASQTAAWRPAAAMRSKRHECGRGLDCPQIEPRSRLRFRRPGEPA